MEIKDCMQHALTSTVDHFGPKLQNHRHSEEEPATDQGMPDALAQWKLWSSYTLRDILKPNKF